MRTNVRLFGLVSAALLGSCHAPAPWAVTTAFIVQDRAEEARQALPALLAEYGFREVRSDLDDPRAPYLFTLDAESIPTTDVLAEVQHKISRWSEQTKVPVALQSAELVFRSLEAKGGARLELRGATSPGAVVLLDFGGAAPIAASVNPDGAWSAAVDSTLAGRLAERNGYVYGLIEKTGIKTFIRMRVLSDQPSERIDVSQLPADSVLTK